MFQKLINKLPTKDSFLSNPNFANLLHLPEAQLLGLIKCQGLMDYFDRIKLLARGNAFFWTKDGHIGTAPHAVDVGDGLALIPGAKALMMLRPTQSNTYKVIGPAHILDMMTREMWKADLIKDNNLYEIFLV
jgi:hypothetical protein